MWRFRFQSLYSTAQCEWVGDSSLYNVVYAPCIDMFQGDLSSLQQAQRAGIAFVVLFLTL